MKKSWNETSMNINENSWSVSMLYLQQLLAIALIWSQKLGWHTSQDAIRRRAERKKRGRKLAQVSVWQDVQILCKTARRRFDSVPRHDRSDPDPVCCRGARLLGLDVLRPGVLLLLGGSRGGCRRMTHDDTRPERRHGGVQMVSKFWTLQCNQWRLKRCCCDSD